MINLRYHIVSLTAVFLAIGIGLTLGSTFLDRATVDNLQGQLESLETRLQEREEQINELEAGRDTDRSIQESLDEQATGLLAGRLEDVPVVVAASRGVDEADVRGAVQALEAAGADTQGILWFTDRWILDDGAEIDDLAALLEETTTDPSRLRRMVIDRLGGALRARQVLVDPVDQPVDDPAGDAAGEEPGVTESPAPGGPEDPATPAEGEAEGETEDGGVDPESLAVLTSLVEIGFIDFEPVPGGPESPQIPPGTRVLLVGGSTSIPDDLVVEPLVERMARAAETPLLAVAGSARTEDGEVSDLVTVIRESEQLREMVATVDDLEHFSSWAAMVLALVDSADGVVGHYGIADGASRLLPPLPAP